MPRTVQASALLLATVATLAACERDPETTSAASPSPSATAPTPSPSATVMATSLYCQEAEDGYLALLAYLEATDAKSAETGKDGNSGDVAVMNARGAEMLAALDTVVAEWTDARDAIVDTEPTVAAAYDDYFASVEVYSRPEASLAATSGSIEEYSLGTLALLGAEGVTVAAGAGAQSLNDVLEFQLERCGIGTL